MTGVENITGTILSEIIFPKVQENISHLLQCANDEEDLNNLEGPIKQNTISNIISNHCVGGPTSDWLTLTILRSFHFRWVLLVLLVIKKLMVSLKIGLKKCVVLVFKLQANR